MDNYFVYHLHSDYSSCVTNIDSATKIDMYINRAAELGMKALAFSEHGSVLNWYEKKAKIEKAGMKYVHGIECYITMSIDKDDKGNPLKVRDNYHCVLLAKNYEGFKEINKLSSKSFNREDGHYYYAPRILMDDIINTSDNIIITSACLGGPLRKGTDEVREKFLRFCIANPNRTFLEIQHHNVPDQIEYNRYLYELSQKYGLNLITGTDTHSLNKELAEARIILQRSHKTFFEEESNWDLTFKTYNELVDAYKKQASLPMDVVLEAINNTNAVESMIEQFDIDTSPKYPQLYDNPEETFRTKIYEAIDNHPYALKNHTKEELLERVEHEIEGYKSSNTIDFMLFQTFLREWEHENDIYVGPGRGSVTGSEVAYLLGITDMDSLKFDLNFWRFINPGRVSNCDIDSDYYDPDREKTREFLLTYPKIKSAEIVAFNTIAIKGAIRDVGRALGMDLKTVGNINKQILKDDQKKDYAPDSLKKEYPELFKYVDLLTGVIVTMGTHPAGVLCATRDIEEEIGLISIKSTKHPVSCLDMYGLDAGMWVKLDLLGLDNIGIINKTCKMTTIPRCTPDNIDLEDWEVWKDIREDTTGIFQWESDFSSQVISQLFSDETIKKIKEVLPNVTYLKLFSFGNALIRPCGATVREKACTGEFNKTGIKELDDMLAPELCNCIVQEDIMKFVMDFCGFTLNSADKLRKAIAKKKFDLLQEMLPVVKQGFIDNTQLKYNLTDTQCNEIIDPIVKCFYDASRYSFSWNHSDAYSFIGYACGWLRHYYPLEFCAVSLNVLSKSSKPDKEEKIKRLSEYLKKKKYDIIPPKFRYSRSDYYTDANTNSIYKGILSIKFMNNSVAEELYALKNNEYKYFIDLLYDISNKTEVNSKQLDILIKLDFFREFGNIRFLSGLVGIFDKFKHGEAKQISISKVADPITTEIIKRHSRVTEKSYLDLETMEILREVEEYARTLNIEDINMKLKVQNQLEYMGYVDFRTGDPKDRTRLLILDIKPLNKKSDGVTWAHSVKTMSIGTGKASEIVIYDKIFKENKFQKFDVIIANPKTLTKKVWNERVSWYLNSYVVEV